MYKNDIDEFLRVCNEAIVELLHKMENCDQEKMDIVSTELRRKLLTTLLENDIITTETYTLEKEKTEPKKEGDLEERSKLAIKKLAQQVLEKEKEIEKLKFQLSQYQPNLEENDGGVNIHSYRF